MKLGYHLKHRVWCVEWKKEIHFNYCGFTDVPKLGELPDMEEWRSDEAEEKMTRSRRVSGPPAPDPYSVDDTSALLPIFIAIGAFLPIVVCLCKLWGPSASLAHLRYQRFFHFFLKKHIVDNYITDRFKTVKSIAGFEPGCRPVWI